MPGIHAASMLLKGRCSRRRVPMPVLRVPMPVLRVPMPLLRVPMPVMRVPMHLLRVPMPVLRVPMPVMRAYKACCSVLLSSEATVRYFLAA